MGIFEVFSHAYYFFDVIIKKTRFLSQYIITDLDGLNPHDEPADVADDLGEGSEGEYVAAPLLPSPSSLSSPLSLQTTRFLFQYLTTNLNGLDPHDEPADVADDLGEDGEGEDDAAPLPLLPLHA